MKVTGKGSLPAAAARSSRGARASRAWAETLRKTGRALSPLPPGPSLRAAAALRVHGVDADFLLTPRAGHNLHLQNPDVFVRQVLGRVH